MPKPFSFGDAVLDVEPGPKALQEGRGPERPFRVLILGDFTGRASRGIFEPELARRPVPIDRDNFGMVFEKLRPAVRLPVSGSESETLTLEFRSLDDFHPDALYDACAWLRELPELAPRAPATPAPPEAPPTAVPGSVSLDDLLEDPGSATGTGVRRAPDAWDHMLHDLVAPHLEPAEARPAPATFEALAAGMRAMLRHPAFQELEAAWRALWYIVRNVETGSDLKISILDVSRAELGADLEAARENLRTSAVWRIVVGEAARTP
ncbi:MAG TPA: type VI secretion system contractile sheath large subunit, partial [Bryobacteraceae bacterium]